MNYDNKKGDMVPVDAPENKEGHHEKDGDHKMIMHQLTNLKQNAEELLDHLSHCSTNHMKEGWVKKKDHAGYGLSRFSTRLHNKRARDRTRRRARRRG